MHVHSNYHTALHQRNSRQRRTGHSASAAGAGTARMAAFNGHDMLAQSGPVGLVNGPSAAAPGRPAGSGMRQARSVGGWCGWARAATSRIELPPSTPAVDASGRRQARMAATGSGRAPSSSGPLLGPPVCGAPGLLLPQGPAAVRAPVPPQRAAQCHTTCDGHQEHAGKKHGAAVGLLHDDQGRSVTLKRLGASRERANSPTLQEGAPPGEGAGRGRIPHTNRGTTC